jgi:hypothetical protein
MKSKRTACGGLLLFAMSFLAAPHASADDLSNMVWMRTDRQRITGNPKLEEQDRIDRSACSAAAESTRSAEIFKGCMIGKGYALLPRAEAEKRLAGRIANQRTMSENKGQIAAEPGDRNEANRRLLALSEKDRRVFFAATLSLSGELCLEAVRTFYKGSAKPSWNAIWNVECKGGPSYSILVMSDEKGSSKVMTCGELRAAGGGECFVRGN